MFGFGFELALNGVNGKPFLTSNPPKPPVLPRGKMETTVRLYDSSCVLMEPLGAVQAESVASLLLVAPQVPREVRGIQETARDPTGAPASLVFSS